jgi:hypothetical protein
MVLLAAAIVPYHVLVTYSLIGPRVFARSQHVIPIAAPPPPNSLESCPLHASSAIPRLKRRHELASLDHAQMSVEARRVLRAYMLISPVRPPRHYLREHRQLTSVVVAHLGQEKELDLDRYGRCVRDDAPAWHRPELLPRRRVHVHAAAAPRQQGARQRRRRRRVVVVPHRAPVGGGLVCGRDRGERVQRAVAGAGCHAGADDLAAGSGGGGGEEGAARDGGSGGGRVVPAPHVVRGRRWRGGGGSRAPVRARRAQPVPAILPRWPRRHVPRLVQRLLRRHGPRTRATG